MHPATILTSIIIVLVLVWIYYLKFHQISTICEIFADDLMHNAHLKTGDLILFKAFNNYNSIFHGSYFGHIGVVVMYNGTPMLFEASGIEKTKLKSHHSKRGIFLTPLLERIKKYKGRCFWKPLNMPIDAVILDEFNHFVEYCLNNFEYDYSVFSGGFKRKLGINQYSSGTDCGQLAFLSIIKLKLLTETAYDNRILHTLKYMCELSRLSNGYKYLPIVDIIDHPFAD